MEPLSEAEFKAYVVKRAKEYIFGTTDSLKDSPINEGVEDSITPNSVKDLVSDLKKINASLSFKEPIIESKVQPIEEMPGRKFHVGSYENVSIDLKETLMETMNHYNRSKDLKHGKVDTKTNWERLVDYKKYSEDK